MGTDNDDIWGHGSRQGKKTDDGGRSAEQAAAAAMVAQAREHGLALTGWTGC
jgi:hypothetical protein